MCVCVYDSIPLLCFLYVEDLICVHSLVQGILSHFVDRVCHHVIPLDEREYQLSHLNEENEFLKTEFAADEASFVTTEAETSAKLEAKTHQLEKERNFAFVEKIQAQNALVAMQADLLETQANVAEGL